MSDVPDAAAAVEAFFETVAHRCRIVDGSRARRSPGLWLLDEAAPVRNPWPREFSFRKSFYGLGDTHDDLAERVAAWLDEPGEEHVVNCFGDEPEAAAERWNGYALTWAFDLFARPVETTAPPPPLPPGFRVRAVDSPRLVAAVNAQQPAYPSSLATLEDPDVHEVVILEGDRPAAKGEIIHRGDFVHVYGMWTSEDTRQRGLGRRVMDDLLREAGRRGARWAVLNASLEATRFDFYPHLGFASATRCARLMRAG